MMQVESAQLVAAPCNGISSRPVGDEEVSRTVPDQEVTDDDKNAGAWQRDRSSNWARHFPNGTRRRKPVVGGLETVGLLSLLIRAAVLCSGTSQPVVPSKKQLSRSNPSRPM